MKTTSAFPVPKSKSVKYLTNKELLAEIGRCKNTYCEFLSKEYAAYDLIVTNLDDVTPLMVEEYLTKFNLKLPPENHKTENEMVIRLMTNEHIPLDPAKKEKGEEVALRTNFPPFKHFLLNTDDGYEFKEVGRSHWEGGFENGFFNPDKGRMTDRLGLMFMMLVDKYSRKGNWRGYCNDTETEALTQRGWLKYDEITTDDTILSYDINDGNMKWSSIKSVYRGEYSGKMFKMDVRGMDSLVTPGHKFITQDGLKKVEYLLETDRIILMGNAVEAPEQKTYGDDFVELMGWFVTEGNIYDRPTNNGKGKPRITIYQNEGLYSDRIRQCLNSLGSGYSEYSRDRNNNGKSCVTFTLNNGPVKDLILEVNGLDNPRKALRPEFILKLTSSQREILINTMIDGDGWRTHQSSSYSSKVSDKTYTTTHIGYAQKDKDHTDSFLMLCTLAGYRVSYKNVPIVTPTGKDSTIYITNFFSKRHKVCRVENVDMHGAKRNGKVKGRGKINHPNEPTVDYNGIVWCPETEYGTFMARRGNYIFLSSNSYRDEMCGSALTQLTRVGLQFDESKSSNPFAFYTTTVSHVFTRTLNLEKRSQNIRDDLLIHHGMMPSHTRQIENAMSSQGLQEPPKVVPKRGRKPKNKLPPEDQS